MTRECVISKSSKGRSYSYEIREADGSLVCFGGPVTKELAKSNAKVLGAKLVDRFSVSPKDES